MVNNFFKINEYNSKINGLQDQLDKKSNENDLIINELNQLKEFRKRKIQMQKEIEEVIMLTQFRNFLFIFF